MIKHSHFYTHIPEKQTEWVKTLLFIMLNNKKREIKELSDPRCSEYYNNNWDKFLDATKKQLEEFEKEETPDQEEIGRIQKILNCKTGSEYITILVEHCESQIKELEELKSKEIEEQINFIKQKAEDRNTLIIEDDKLYAKQGGLLFSQNNQLFDIFTIPVQDELQIVKSCKSLEDCIERCKEAGTILVKKEIKKVEEFFKSYPDSIIIFQ